MTVCEPILRLVPEQKRRILEALAVEHEMEVHRLTNHLGVHVATTEYHLRTMIAVGAVRKRVEHSGDGGRPKYWYSLTPEVLA